MQLFIFFVKILYAVRVDEHAVLVGGRALMDWGQNLQEKALQMDKKQHKNYRKI